MSIHAQHHDSLRQATELLIGINRVCVLTAASCGRLVCHPMNLLELDERGDFWFFASYRVASQMDLSFINLAFSDENHTQYISLSGRAELVHDRMLIEALWTPAIKPLFSHGKDDADLVLMKFSTHTVAYWDAKSNKLVRLLANAAAFIGKQLIGNSQAEAPRHEELSQATAA